MTATADDEEKAKATVEEETTTPGTASDDDAGNNDEPAGEQGPKEEAATPEAKAPENASEVQKTQGPKANGGDEVCTAGCDEDDDTDDDADKHADDHASEAALPVAACEKKFDYACSRETVRLLAHMMTPGDRDRVESWLVKLDECEDEQVRSQYLNFLLTVLASETNLNVEPFHAPPMPGPLRRLGEVVDPTLLFGLALVELPTGPPARRTTTPTTRETREKFFSRNPVPEDGVFCYAAAFSDIDDEHED